MHELTLLTRALVGERKDIALAIVGGFVAGVAGVGLFSASGYLISQAVVAPPLYSLIVLISIVKLLGLLRAVSRYGERLFSHRATFSLLSRLRSSFFAQLAPLVPRVFRRQRSGDLLARIVGDVESLQHYFLRVAYPPMMVVLVFLATVLFASVFSLWIAGVLVLGMLTTAFVVPALVLLGQRRLQGRAREQRAQLSTEAAEALYGFRDLKVYGQLAAREQQLQHSAEVLTTEQHAAARHLLRGQSLHTFVAYLVTWGVLALGAYLIAEGALAGVMLAMLVLAALTLFEEAAPMATLPAYKRDSAHAARRLLDTVREAQGDVESVREGSEGNDAASGGETLYGSKGQGGQRRIERNGQGIPSVADSVSKSVQASALAGREGISIEMRGLSFQYADEWRPALRDVATRLAAGSKTAIVGPSGAGKSTIFELLLKLQMPTTGEVLLNGVSTAELAEEQIWQVANVVLQQSHFFRGTLRDNLLLPETRSFADEELLDILAKVQLPGRGLDDEILEKGENLSDGEKQRLALARAMLKGGRLWLLDEPTSALDVVTEQAVMANVMAQAAEDTVLLISHRLSGLDQMDCILVMDGGRLVEQGSYSELMVRKGYLYELKQLEQEVMRM